MEQLTNVTWLHLNGNVSSRCVYGRGIHGRDIVVARTNVIIIICHVERGAKLDT